MANTRQAKYLKTTAVPPRKSCEALRFAQGDTQYERLQYPDAPVLTVAGPNPDVRGWARRGRPWSLGKWASRKVHTRVPTPPNALESSQPPPNARAGHTTSFLVPPPITPTASSPATRCRLLAPATRTLPTPVAVAPSLPPQRVAGMTHPPSHVTSYPQLDTFLLALEESLQQAYRDHQL